MTDAATPAQGLINIGEQAKPPFAVLPVPTSLFKSRAMRLRALAPGHDLEPYLTFLATLSDAQHRVAQKRDATPCTPVAGADQALAHRLAPLGSVRLSPGSDGRAAIAALVEELSSIDMPEATRNAVQSLAAAGEDELDKIIVKVLNPTPNTPDDDVARSALAFAALQVHFARLAAELPAEPLSTVEGTACPACASAPVSSTVVNWPRASNTRFCTCALCATMWHVVRVKCVLCHATGGISYRAIEGKPETIKAECCDACHAFVKLLSQLKDPALDAVADDVATLALDMLMSEEGWKRGALNPFLLGY